MSRPRVLGVKKRNFWLPLSLLLYSVKTLAQDASVIIVLPDEPITFIQAFARIEAQLKFHISHDPNCPEFLRTCNSHGKTTFAAFFAPLDSAGFTFHFMHIRNSKMLVIKRRQPTPPAKPSSRKIQVQVVDEGDEPLSGATIEKKGTPGGLRCDSSGIAYLINTTSPVTLFLSYVGMHSAIVTINRTNSTIALYRDPQSLEECTVTYGGAKRAFSTSDNFAIINYTLPQYGRYRRLDGVSNATPQSMLEGLTTGLLFTQSSGIPGSSSYLTIRGQSSIVNGTDPLYVIDGVPVACGNQSISYIATGNSAQSLSVWSLISPSDIDRIDVLKDADATAIYGSRGANGVVLITTRRWKAGLPKLDVQFSTGLSSVIRRTPLMNTYQYLASRHEALSNSGITPVDSYAPDLRLVDTTRSFDWGKWLIGNVARLDNVRMAVSGGGKKNSYTVGANYFKEATPFPTNPDHHRLDLNFNYNHSSTSRRWTIQVAGLAGWDWNHQSITLDPTTFQNLAPDAPPPLNKEGNLNFRSDLLYENPLASMRQPYEARSANYLVSVVNTYRVTPQLSFKSTLGINQVQAHEFGAMPFGSLDPADSQSATGYFAYTRFQSRVFEPQLQYRRKFGGMTINWLGGVSFQLLTANASSSADTGYASDLALARHEHATLFDSSTYRLRESYTAYFSSLNGNWKDRYIVNLTARRDGSNRFDPGKRSANFGAIGAAWIFSNEKFFARASHFISFGKLKLNTGVTGNNQIGDRTLENVVGTYTPIFQSLPGLYPSNPIPGSKGWETTRKTELSLDLGFWKNHVFLTATAYRHRSDNLIVSNQPPSGPASSFQSQWPVTLENRGVELTLTANLVDNSTFGWDVAANWTFPAGKLIAFPQLDSSPYADRLVIGQSLNVLKGYVFQGVDAQTGIYKFADLDKDGQLTSADRRVVGTFDVTGFGGLDNMIRWKRFQFDILFDARLQTGVNYLAAVFANNSPGSLNRGLSSNLPTVLMNHWRYPGDNAAYQKFTAAPDVQVDSALYRYLNSSALFANASFLRLRRLSISYNLPVTKSQALHLSSLTIFINGQNLLLFTPYKGADPEIQSLLVLPTMRTVEAGARLTF